MNKTLKMLAVFLLPTLLAAEVKTMVNVDFSKTRNLNGWQYWDKKGFQTDFKLEKGILTTSPKVLGGLIMTLPQPVKIDNTLKKVIFQVVMKPKRTPAHIIAYSLSTSKGPCPGYTAPFHNPGEGGVRFAVCYFNSNRHQSIHLRKNGREVIRTRPYLKPFNMTKAEQWCTLTFTIDNVNKRLTTHSSIGNSFSLQKADLTGMTLNSLFISGMGTSYKSVKFSVER